MGDDAEYEMERQEEERKWAAMENRSDPGKMAQLIDAIVDNHIPASKIKKSGESRVVRN